MPNNNRLRRIYNLKKKSKEQEEKAYEYGDGYHQNMPGTTAKEDRKMMRHMKKSEKASAKAEKLWKKHEEDEDKKKSPVSYADTLKNPLDEDPFKYVIIEGVESAPINYKMNGAKFKESSPNQAFSSKDFHLIQRLQNNYKMPSEGNFKTNSQNIYASFDSPLAFRGMNAAFAKDSGPTRAMWALKMGDRITQQNAQGLQNASTVTSMVTDIAKMAGSIATGGLFGGG